MQELHHHVEVAGIHKGLVEAHQVGVVKGGQQPAHERYVGGSLRLGLRRDGRGALQYRRPWQALHVATAPHFVHHPLPRARAHPRQIQVLQGEESFIRAANRVASGSKGGGAAFLLPVPTRTHPGTRVLHPQSRSRRAESSLAEEPDHLPAAKAFHAAAGLYHAACSEIRCVL